MTADGLWVPRRQAPCSSAQISAVTAWRTLFQIGWFSQHDWFEGRAPKCCLLVFGIDATGRLIRLRFGDTESPLIT